jgi:hypothetical protein
MTPTPNDVIQSFYGLPPAEQHLVFVEICRTAAKWDNDPMTDEELCCQADELFSLLDQQEEQHGGGAAG